MKKTDNRIHFFSGVKCPTIRRDPDDPKKETAEPFAAEAKFFVESRLLQRDVQIILEGVSNQNILLATVLHPVRCCGGDARCAFQAFFKLMFRKNERINPNSS